jgi:hypothetical protein
MDFPSSTGSAFSASDGNPPTVGVRRLHDAEVVLAHADGRIVVAGPERRVECNAAVGPVKAVR